MPRHGSEHLIENEEEIYEEFFEERGVNKILHYRSPRWPPLDAKARQQFTSIKHVWKLGDKWWKLSSQYYGDPKLWWVLAWYNQSPTEANLKKGQIVYVPQPISSVLSFFNYGSI